MKTSGQFHAATAVRKKKRPQYLLNKRLCGPQNGSGCLEIRLINTLKKLITSVV